MLHRAGKPADWREYAFSEYDFGTRSMRLALGIAEKDARLIMACDRSWKYIHCENFRPILFDLANDPNELVWDEAEFEQVFKKPFDQRP